MNQLKKLLAAAVLGLLAFVYWWGGNAPSLHGWRIAEDAPQAAETSIPEEFLKNRRFWTRMRALTSVKACLPMRQRSEVTAVLHLG